MKTLIIAALMTGAGCAQQVVAPTQVPVGPPSGDNTSDYNIVNSIETGYRWISVAGDPEEYKSQVNYGNGVRLLGSSFSMFSRDGHGKYFDELTLTTVGLGGDPYESATLRIAKNNLYRFDMTWRLNDYYNPGLTSAGQTGGNFRDTRYTSQDDNLTLFPQSKIKFFIGYSRSVQEGPEITNVGAFLAAPVSTTAPAPIPAAAPNTAGFTSLRDATNEYRVGNEFQLLGITVNWMHGWQDFKEDFLTPPVANGTPNTQFINPYHGTSPYWRVGLFTNRKWFSVNGRFTYTGTRRAYVSEQSPLLGAAGPNLGAFQVVTMGTGNRPAATGNLTLSIFLGPKLTLTNSTGVYNIRTEGDSEFLQLNNGTGQFVVQDFQYLGIRTITNQTDLNYQMRKWIGFFAGYHYSDRSINSVLTLGMPAYQQTSILNAGVFGVRIKPLAPLTILLDGEVGHANRPFSPKSDKNYQALNARVQYKKKSLLLSAYAQTNYNNDSITLTAFSSHARTYAANFSWSPLGWLSFNADYVKLHLDTLGGLSFFDSGSQLQNQYSLYISNLQTGNIGLRFALGKYVDLYAGYSHIQDTGDGRSNPLGTGFGTTIPEFQAAQTFPMRYLSPLARLSVKVTNRVRWNVGYQYYGYHEDFFTGQDFLPDHAYRATTGYSSVLWSF
jgi:hypothetical protein